MKIAVIAGYAPSLLNFRAPLLRTMRERGHDVVALAPDDALVAAALDDFGVSFVPIQLQRSSTNPLSDAATLRSIAIQLHRIQPNKVLSYTPKPVIWGSLAARIVGVTEIYALITGLGRAFSDDVANTARQWALNRTVRLLYRVGLAPCRGVVFQNRDDQALFARLHLVRRGQPTTVTAGSGIDLDHFAQTPAHVSAHPTFLTLTRLLADKGVPEFVGAAAALKPKFPHAEFRVVGPRESGIGGISDAIVEDWAARGHSTFVPAVADVRPELQRASVYVLASAYREGVPRSILEALSVGRPIITTDTPGCRETVIHGRNGFLIPPRDTRALTDAMQRFLLNPNLIEQMGAESRRLAMSRFDVRVVNAQMLSFIGLA